jgi:hypothetical protein
LLGELCGSQPSGPVAKIARCTGGGRDITGIPGDPLFFGQPRNGRLDLRETMGRHEVHVRREQLAQKVVCVICSA